MTFRLHHLVGQHTGTNQNAGQRTEKLTAESDGMGKQTAHKESMLSAIDFGHDLAKKKQEERKQHRDTHKLEPLGRAKVYHAGKEIVAQHDDGHVDQVVGNENGGQRTLALRLQTLDDGIALTLLRVKLVQVVGRQREERNLGT